MMLFVVAQFWISGIVWLAWYFNLCKNIGFKNSIVLVFETQIELIKKFLFLLVGYYPELNNIQKISLNYNKKPNRFINKRRKRKNVSKKQTD